MYKYFLVGFAEAFVIDSLLLGTLIFFTPFLFFQDNNKETIKQAFAILFITGFAVPSVAVAVRLYIKQKTEPVTLRIIAASLAGMVLAVALVYYAGFLVSFSF